MDVSLCRHEMPEGSGEIYLGRFSHFAHSCFLFIPFTCWVYGFRDMIEYEWTPPYIKVSACCVNSPRYVQTYIRWEIDEEKRSSDGAFACWGKECVHLLSQAVKTYCKVPKKEDASSCHLERSDQHWSRHLPLSSVRSCTHQVTAQIAANFHIAETMSQFAKIGKVSRSPFSRVDVDPEGLYELTGSPLGLIVTRQSRWPTMKSV